MPLFSNTPDFIWSANTDGLAIRFASQQLYAKVMKGAGDEDAQSGFLRMQMLTESGQAEVEKLEQGIFITASDAVRLDLETREGFLLPPPWPGGMRLQTESVPQSPSFRARVGLVEPGAQVRWDWKLRGPILEVGGENYLPTAAQFAALLAMQAWRDAGQRDEYSNLSLIATLREAHLVGCHIELEAYSGTLVANAAELSIDARADAVSGDLILRPMVDGNFPALSADDIEQRMGQLAGDASRAVLRVRQTIVLLDPKQTQQANALAQRGRVPKAEVEAFARNPAAWMAEHIFPDIETEFSPRVTGIGVWKAGYAGSMWEEGEDWFGKKPEPEKKPRSESEEAAEQGEDGEAEEMEIQGPMVPLPHTNDKDRTWGWPDAELDEAVVEPDFLLYARTPMEHQRKAVLWLLRHARRALKQRDTSDGVTGHGAGALLADDMGLGKTFSTLMFLREWFDLWRATFSAEPPAVLIVAPLSLLENWKGEIEKSYGSGNSVFSRVLIAQADGELQLVKRHTQSRDRAVPGEVLEYGLGYGDGTERSLDFPGSCVLTTYQTLRDYRFSFAKAEWSAVIFDEAQNIKNPNALQTIAAKSLKGLFRLTLTGTPVENHLGDFWSILDTSEPGPLGSFAEFREKWINPMRHAGKGMGDIGQRLRDHIGELMLRRMKEDELTGLPKKSGHDCSITVELTSEQVSAYDAIVMSVQDQNDHTETENGTGRQNRQLAALWHLRQVSLHPDLLAGGSIPNADNAREARRILHRSGKLTWLLNKLDEIKTVGEKVLIFCVLKKLQESLARQLSLIYGLNVPVINGDTKVNSRRTPEETRLGLLAQFGSKEGFAICILSPIAAGAGLNIVEANHVIHLERHWNPAKEDQATDRAYRIGQTRAVSVYLPAARHPNPECRSFDDVLHGLIQKKRGLQGALGLVPPQSVTDSELINEVLSTPSGSKPTPISFESALKLSWRLFEALIAVIYEGNADRVILTPGGSDHGCDVVVLGWGPMHENVLIQCKMTSQDKFDSEVAVREVEGARPFYEGALGVKFPQRCLHTTARRFSQRTAHAANICGVSLHDRNWLSRALAVAQISLEQILCKDATRERI